MNKYKVFSHTSIQIVVDYMNQHMIRKENIVSICYDGTKYVLVYNTEKSYH